MTNKNSTYKRLGDYIEQRREKNKGFDVPIRGVSREGFIPPKQQDADVNLYNVFYKNDFVFNPARMELNSIALNEDLEQGICSSLYEIFYIKDTNVLDPLYLNLLIKTDHFTRFCEFVGWGSVREYCRFADISEYYIEVPPIEEQHKIVSHFNAIRTRISNNKQTIAKLEEAAQALYRKMFVDDVDVENLPEGWRMGTIEEISEKIVAGTIPKYDDTSSYMVLGQKCNKNGILDLNLCKRHIPKDNCLFLQKKDILVNSTGDGTLGRVGQIWFEPEKLAFDSNMTLVRPLNRYSEYLGCVLLNKQDYFVQISQGSTNQTRLYCSMIKPVPLIIPSDIILYDFSKAIKPMKEHVYLLYKENEKLKEMLSMMA